MPIDVKISELLSGILPLTGAEEVPVTQGGLTVRVPVSAIIGAPSAAGQVHLYVSAANGNDASDGLTPATALATLAAAIALILDRTLVTIHIASGTNPIAVDGLGLRFPGHVCLVGDGGGQPGDTGVTTLLTDAVNTTANAYTITPAIGGMTIDAFKGKTLRWTSGDNAGRRVSVRSNTAVDIVLVYPAVSAIQASDAFVIEGPAVVITNPAGEVLTVANGCGTPEGHRSPGHATNSALWLANLRFDTDADLVVAGSRVHAWGVEFTGQISPQNSSIRAGTARGYAANATSDTADAEWTTIMTSLFGTYAPASADDWHGWGVYSTPPTFNDDGDPANSFMGYVVAGSYVAASGHTLAGGRIADLTVPTGVGSVEVHTDTTPLVMDTGDGITAHGAVAVHGPIEITSTGDAVRAYVGGNVRFASPATATLTATGFGANVYFGGGVVFDAGLPTFAATAGDLTVDDSTPLVAATVLPSDGSVVFGPGAAGPGSIFRR